MHVLVKKSPRTFISFITVIVTIQYTKLKEFNIKNNTHTIVKPTNSSRFTQNLKKT